MRLENGYNCCSGVDWQCVHGDRPEVPASTPSDWQRVHRRGFDPNPRGRARAARKRLEALKSINRESSEVEEQTNGEKSDGEKGSPGEQGGAKE